MKILCWNVWGLGGRRTVRHLWHVLKQYKPIMVFFMETKLDVKRMESVRRRCGFDFCFEIVTDGSKGGICLTWKNDVLISIRKYSINFIDASINSEDGVVSW